MTEPGAIVAGFRLERSLPPREGWLVWEATQLALDRTVMLELLPAPPDADAGWATGVLEDVRRSIAQDGRTVYAAGALPEGVYVARRAGRSPKRRPRLSRTALGAGVIAAIGLALLAMGRLDRAANTAAELPAPPRPANTVALGAPLAAEATRTEDCAGLPPAAGSPDCSIAPLSATVPQDGLVRGWAVRGARGALALQVLRKRPDGTYQEMRRSQATTVPHPGPHVFLTELPVRRGDLLGLIVSSGAGVGVRRGRGRALRWTGPLLMPSGPRRPGTWLRDRDVQLRVDFAPGAKRRPRPALPTGAGEVLETEEVEPPGGDVGSLAVVRLPEAVVVDAVLGGRVRRLPVPEADPAGRIVEFEQSVTEMVVVRLRWQNPRDLRLIEHSYIVDRRGARLFE